MSIDLPGIIAAIKAALPIAEQLAKITTTTWDDRAVALLRLILDNQPLIDFLHAIISNPAVVNAAGEERTVAIQACAGEHCTDVVKTVVEKAGFSWAALLTYLPLVIRLVLTVLGQRA